jgi:hypothetical protein
MTSPAIIVGIIAVMTRQTRRAVQGFRMAIAAGSATVIHITSAFVGDARVRTAILCRPILHSVTRGAIQTEQACMKSGVTVTAGTCGR